MFVVEQNSSDTWPVAELTEIRDFTPTSPPNPKCCSNSKCMCSKCVTHAALHRANQPKENLATFKLTCNHCGKSLWQMQLQPAGAARHVDDKFRDWRIRA